MSDPLYPFDPLASNPLNLIQNEAHTLVPVTWKDFHYVIPKAAPFFGDSLEIINVNTGAALVEGIDYLKTHKFISASRATAKPVYGSFTFFNREYSGVIRLKYRTLGGDWLVTDAIIEDILMNSLTNPRVTAWEQVYQLPYQFPTIDHEWDLNDMVGVADVKAAIGRITQALLDRFAIAPSLSSHISNQNNPHAVTKGQVGLGNVENFPIATLAEALDGIADQAYMTPRRTRQSIEKFAYGYTLEALTNYFTKDEAIALLEQAGLANEGFVPVTRVDMGRLPAV